VLVLGFINYRYANFVSIFQILCHIILIQ